MPSRTRLTPLQLAGIALATGVGWGIVMALVAWLRTGSEVVLLQGWILVAAWGFGRLAGNPQAGALAGLAVVAGAVWTYEFLPGWGLEAGLRREGAPAEDLPALAAAFDAEDIVLLTTLAVGILIGMGGGLRPTPSRPVAEEIEAPPAAVAAPPAAPAAPPPLWAGFGEPRPAAEAPSSALWSGPEAAPRPAEVPPRTAATAPAAAVREAGMTPWGSAFLLAALGTDFFFGRAFGLYSEPQDGVALGFVVVGLAGTVWLARRYAVAMVVAAAVLAGGFAAVQHAEFDERRGPVPQILR